MPRPSRSALLLLLLLLGGLVSCDGEVRRGDPDLQLDIEVEPDPATVGRADVQVEVAEVDWTPRNGDRVFVTGSWDEIVLARDTALGQGAGVYRAEGVRLEVAGDWILTVRVETRDGRWVEVDRPLRVEAPASP